MDLLELAKQAVEQASRLGSEQSEAYVLNATSLDIEVHGGEVETLNLAEGMGIGLTTIQDGRLGFAYTSLLEKKNVQELAHSALENGRLTAVDAFRVLPEKQEPLGELHLYDPDIAQCSVEEKIAQACLVEKTARAYDEKIQRTRKCSYGDVLYRTAIVNSLGIAYEYQAAYCGLSASVLAEQGEEVQTGWGMQLQRKYGDLNPVAIGEEAAERAVSRLGAERIASQQLPVVFDPYVGCNFLNLILPSLTGEALQKGKSLFQDKKQVASKAVTLVDDGLLVGGIGTAPVDDEGVPQMRKVLVADGQLEQLLYNTYTAKKAGVLSTGNGRRASYQGLTATSATNFFLASGTVSPSELLQPIAKGLYITEVMGLHTANPISGDFSLGASGFLIENGQKTRAVKGVAIAGNLLDLLADIDLVADDLRFYGSVGSPTMRIQKMTISG